MQSKLKLIIRMWIHSPGQLCEAAKNGAEGCPDWSAGGEGLRRLRRQWNATAPSQSDVNTEPRASARKPVSLYPTLAIRHLPLNTRSFCVFISRSRHNLRVFIQFLADHRQSAEIVRKTGEKGFTCRCAFPRLAAPRSWNSRRPSAANFRIQINPRTMMND